MAEKGGYSLRVNLDEDTAAYLAVTADLFGWSIDELITRVAPRLQDLIEVERLWADPQLPPVEASDG